MIDAARKERLTRELAESELALDALTRSMEPGKMRTQAAIEGQRSKVYGLRAELLQIALTEKKGEKNSEARKEIRDEWSGLLVRLEKANQAARAAASQAADDEIGEMLRRLNQADAFAVEVAKLH